MFIVQLLAPEPTWRATKDQEKMEKYQVSIPKIKVIFKDIFLLHLGPWGDT
jgi:hypothetical protein